MRAPAHWMLSHRKKFVTVLEFTYDNKQYVLPGDSEVALSEVLDTVGLTGEVSAVEVSDENLFSAKKCKTAEGGNTPEKDEDGNAVEDENGTWKKVLTSIPPGSGPR